MFWQRLRKRTGELPPYKNGGLQADLDSDSELDKGHKQQGGASSSYSSTKPSLSETIRQRSRPHLDIAVLAIFAVGPVIEHTHAIPAVVLKYTALAGVAYLAYKLLTFKRWSDEHRQVPRFVLCFVAMLAELAFENGMVWIVSATDQRKYQKVPGLQDNVQIAVELLAKQSAALYWLIHARWAHILHFLAALLALAFSVIWQQVPFSGFGIMSRVVLTICCSRLLRVVCFMSTVLPNPRSGCYASRFHAVPDTWWLILKAGYTHIRGFGGCNDLIFSGHGAFWVLAPLALQTYHPGHFWGVAVLWVALIQTSVRDVLEFQHYSVDMILAVVVTWAVWTWLEWVYPPTNMVRKRQKNAPADPMNVFVIALVVFALLAAGIIVIGGKA